MGASFKELSDHVPKVVAGLTAKGRYAATNELRLAIGVSLRDPAGLENFAAQVSDPASSNYRQFLTREELTTRFGPTAEDYAAVQAFAQTNGLTIVKTHDNRLLLDVIGSAAAVEQAFHITLRTYQHPTEARDFFAPDTEPTVDAALPVADIEGLSNFSRPRPLLVRNRVKPNINNVGGTAPGGSGNLFGNDFRNAYAPGSTLTGAGQSVGLVEFEGYYPGDINKYAVAAGNGRTNIIVQAVLLDGYNGTPAPASYDGDAEGEVALDIEMAMAMAPGLSKIISYEISPYNTGATTQNDILNAMLANSNVLNLSCSWSFAAGPSATTDGIFQSMAAVGQTFFNATGDDGAFTTGASSVNGVDNPSLGLAPSSNPYIVQVGGTTLTLNGSGARTSEVVWNWGSGFAGCGGISSYYTIPSWQTNVSNLALRGGSAAYRNIPDVAANADDIFVIESNGLSLFDIGGTSAAAPLWAGFMALVNQQAAARGENPVGFVNPALYLLGTQTNTAACFYDITSGNNTWSRSPNLFYATNGYDLCTGLGTMNGTNLINALAPPPLVVSLLALPAGGANFQLQFLSQAARTHTVQYRTNLLVGSWLTFTNLIGNGTVKTVSVPFSLFGASSRQGFVRISTR